MSAAVMSTLDVGESFSQNRRNSNNACRIQQTAYERRQYFANSASTTTAATSSYSQSRHRNLSGPSSMGTRSSLDNRTLLTSAPSQNVQCVKESNAREIHGYSGRDTSHRKLDRSLSDCEDRINGNGGNNGRGVNSARYKTELCRPFEENGHCKYGDKCQFAHGAHELRNLTRHPKYKTERCRTYHTIGFCPYGPRCHFIHNEDERNEKTACQKNVTSSRLPSQQQRILPASSSSKIMQRPNNLCGLSSIGSSYESVSMSSSSPGNLSPSLNEDLFPSITTFSPPSTNDPLPQDTEHQRSSPIFNFPASDAAGVGSILTPLQIQTQQFYNNVLDMAALRFSTMLNISQNQRNNANTFATNLNVCANMSMVARQQVNFEPDSSGVEKLWPSYEVGSDFAVSFPPQSTSPVSSNSDDSMGSTGSLESSSSPLDNSYHLINSPLEVGRSMRLPIFNQLSTE